MIIDFLFKKSKVMRKILVRIYARLEGGVFRSPTLRQLYRTYKNIDAGYGSYGWTSDLIDGPITIGKYTSIGKNLRRICVNHPLHYVTTHPCAFNPALGWVSKDPRVKSKLAIGNDVWIGDNVTILPSVTSIADGAVIAAGAVVSKDISPYEIVGGVPARFIKKRFSEDKIELLEKMAWWDLSEEQLKGMQKYFSDVDLFLETYGNSNKEGEIGVSARKS